MRTLIAQPGPDRALLQRIDDLQRRLDDLTAHPIATVAPPPPPPPRTPPRTFGLDPNKLFSVKVGTSPVEGPANAKVTMIATSDYACPYCEKVMATFDDLRKKYGNDLRIVHKSFIVHKYGSTDVTAHAVAACAANKQHKWRAMDDLLWKEAFHARAFDAATLDTIAEHAKLDMKKYRADVPGCQKEIDDENAVFQKLGVGAIPTMFINGHAISGAQPIEAFTKIIDAALADANTAIGRGVKQDRYYDQEIVAKGTDTGP